MNRRNLNRISAILPLVMSAIALLLAMAAGLAGWARGATDEGALAHIFQLLIVAQAPFVVVFLITAKWSRILPVARPLMLQAFAIAMAVAPVAYFRL